MRMRGAPSFLSSISRRLGWARQERWILILMGIAIGLLLGAYTVAKVLRDSLFITTFGARSLPYGYVAVAVASAFFVWLDPWLIRRVHRAVTALASYLVAIAAAIAAAILYPIEHHWLAAGFYVWTGSQLMMLIPHFWLLALDRWDNRRARVVFPILTGFGLLGGVMGGALAHFALPRIGVGGLFWTFAAMLCVATLVVAVLLGRRPARAPSQAESTGEPRLIVILRSPFLRYLALTLTLSVIVGTLVDFQFKVMVERSYPERDALTRFLGGFHAGLNGFAMLMQFTAAGWILRHLGLGFSAAVQPASVFAFSLWSVVTPIWGVVLALRWVQGVIFQTLGKSASEIYYLAVRPPERRRIKGGIDVVTERGADALVGLALVVLLRLYGADLKLLAGISVALAGIWLLVQMRLHREYTRAFRDSLAGHWIEPEEAVESLRTSAARHVIVDALRSGDGRLVILALELCVTSGYRQRTAIRASLEHPSARVRSAAVRAMQALAIDDETGRIEAMVLDPDELLRRTAIAYLLARRQDAGKLARDFLASADPLVRDAALEGLATRPELVPEALDDDWIDRHLASPEPSEIAAGARAAGLRGGPEAAERLRGLITHPELPVEVKEAALGAAARMGGGGLEDVILPLLYEPELCAPAVAALTAAGDRVVPALKAMIEEGSDSAAETAAASALASIGTRAAREALVALVHSDDRNRRYLGIRNLNRIRIARDEPVLDRPITHRLFVRELRDYRRSWSRARVFDGAVEPELRLLADSFAESADRALDRACRVLACWYEAAPFGGVYRSLASADRDTQSRALEYLDDILPRQVFRLVRQLFETDGAGREAAGAGGAAGAGPPRPSEIVESILRAWEGGDPWLQACAVQASVVAGVELAARESVDPLVRAEMERFALQRSA